MRRKIELTKTGLYTGGKVAGAQRWRAKPGAAASPNRPPERFPQMEPGRAKKEAHLSVDFFCWLTDTQWEGPEGPSISLARV